MTRNDGLPHYPNQGDRDNAAAAAGWLAIVLLLLVVLIIFGVGVAVGVLFS